MRIKTSVNPKGQIYIPTKVREAVGMKLGEAKDVILIGDMKALFIIPDDLTSEEALKSLAVIREHLKHRAETEEIDK